MKIRQIMFWFLSFAVALVSYRFVVLGMDEAFAGVTLRVILPVQLLTGTSIEVAYPAVAWLCWVPNLAVAEFVIRRSKNSLGHYAETRKQNCPQNLRSPLGP